MSKGKIQNIYPLSPLQEGILFHHLMLGKGESDPYIFQFVIHLEGDIRQDHLRGAFCHLVERYDVLRTVIRRHKVKQPLQVVLKQRQFDLTLRDIRHLEEDEQQEAIRTFARQDKQRGFDLSRDLLMRAALFTTGTGTHTLVWTIHHIIMDGWSMGLLFRELVGAYSQLKVSAPLTPEPVIPYVHYIQWLNRQPPDAGLKYWKEYLSGCDTPTELPLTGTPASGGFEEANVSFKLSRTVTRRLREIALEHGVTLNILFQCVWGLLLRRYGNQEALFGVVVSGRPPEIPGIEEMVGLFINTLPFRLPAGETDTFPRLLRRVKEQETLSKPHEYVSLAEVQACSPLGNRLLSHILVFENFPVQEEIQRGGGREKGDFSVAGLEMSGQADYPFYLLVVPGEELEVSLKYNGAVYSPDDIQRVGRHIARALGQVAAEPGISPDRLDILPDLEKRQLLREWSSGASLPPVDKTVGDLAAEQALKTPDRVAVVNAGRWLTYGELDRRARQGALLLRRQGLGPGMAAALPAEPSIPLAVAVLAAWKAGAVYLPVDTGAPPERIDYILRDSGARMVELRVFEPAEDEPDCDATPGVTFDAPLESPPPSAPSHIIYTSGTTGKSKGTLLEHRNLANYVRWFSRTAGLTPESRGVLTSSFAFDLGYTSFFPPLAIGGQLHLVDRETYLAPERLLRYLLLGRISYIKATPSLFSIMVNTPHFSAEYFETLDLLVLGGEAIEPSDVGGFHRSCPWVRVINHYGPSETTIGSVYFSIDFSDFRRYSLRPVIGRPIDNTVVAVMDPRRRAVPVGVPGELYIGGHGVARGYLNNPRLTAERFITPAAPTAGDGGDSGDSGNSTLLYNTGDLARWLPDGTLEFLGRRDRQVKLRGYRIEPAEIEHLLSQQPGIEDSVVIIRETGGGKSLCAYMTAEAGPPPDMAALKDALRTRLPEYMVPTHMMQLQAIPLTPNGKVDRRALPEPSGPVLESTAAHAAPRDPMQERLVAIWAEVLGLQPEQVGIHGNFFLMGGHSLRATVLVSRIHQALEVLVPLAEVFNHPTVSELAAYIQSASKEDYQPVPPAEKQEYYPLSPAQKRMYVLQQMDPQSTGYNMPSAVLLKGRPEPLKVERALQRLIARHEALRTSFFQLDGQPVQRIHPTVPFKLEKTEDAGIGPDEPRRERSRYSPGSPQASRLVTAFVRPFDLSRAPLMRAALVTLDPGTHVLVLDFHHIISDGTANGILAQELLWEYREKPLPPLRIHYKDYALWQSRPARQQHINRQEAFWLEVFPPGTPPPVLELPLDYPRPRQQSFAGRTLWFRLGEEIAAGLKAHARRSGSTLYMVLLTLYAVLTGRLGGQEDTVVGTPTAGRRHADLVPVIGMFINTLALRLRPRADITLAHLLEETKHVTLGAFRNEDYPFERLVSRLALPQDLRRNPLFDTMFMLRNYDIPAGPAPAPETPGLYMEPYPYDPGVSPFDLTMAVTEGDTFLEVDIEYCTRLFKAETIRRFFTYFRNIAAAFCRDGGVKIGELDILPPEEKRQVLTIFNDTRRDFPTGVLPHRLLEDWARRQPDAVAVTGPHNRQLTYRELNRGAGAVARWFKETGIAPGAVAALVTDASLEAVVGILGTWKAGCAYMPVDPKYPQERIAYMMEDSGARAMLTGEKTIPVSSLSQAPALLELHSLEPPPPSAASTAAPAPEPADLCYIIYTSGTTGRPKGVAVEHRASMNRLWWVKEYYGLGRADVILQKTPLTFDVSVCELFRWLPAGGRLAIAGTGVEKDPPAMVRAVSRYHAATIDFVPVMLNLFLEHIRRSNLVGAVSSLRWVVVGVEAIAIAVVDTFKEVLFIPNNTRLVNAYGPTEATVDTVVYPCFHRDETDPLPIGKPIANTRVIIRDSRGRLQPIGVAGELCIGGHSLARGYLNRPELTANQFVEAHGGTLYRTGDRACWLADGNLRFLGRLDRQVKIRGHRVEPGEVENRLKQHPGVKDAVVTVYPGEGEKGENIGGTHLFGYYVPHSPPPETGELERYMGRYLPHHMVPTGFIAIPGIPLTTNGKIDRARLPRPRIERTVPYAAPRDRSEQIMVRLWGRCLRLEVDSIGIDDNFFHLGGNSLTALELTGKCRGAFHADPSLRDLFENPTVRQLCALPDQPERRRPSPDADTESRETMDAGRIDWGLVAEAREYYPLSPAQRRMYILQQMEDGNTGYNIPLAVILEGPLQVEKLRGAFSGLIRRHESLRTSFHMLDGRPVQKVHPPVEFELETHLDAPGSPRGPRVSPWADSFVRPFDLAQYPLFRAGLFREAEQRHVLMVDMHHIVSDGISHNLLMADFAALYNGEQLPPLAIQYKEYALWVNRPARQAALAEQESWWLEVFKQGPPPLDLPLDRPREAVQRYDGALLGFEIAAAETAALKALAAEHGMSLYMVLLAAIDILLFKLCGSEDIVVGTPSAGRPMEELGKIIGVFINTLPLRNFPRHDKPVNTFLPEVKHHTLQALENQDYPFENLVEKVVDHRAANRNPLFDVMWSMEDYGLPAVTMGGLNIREYPLEKETSPFDLSFHGMETDGKLQCSIQYGVRLFSEDSIHRFSRYFRRVTAAMIRDPRQMLREIDVLDPQERRFLLSAMNRVPDAFSVDNRLHRLVSLQVERTPRQPAVVAFDNDRMETCSYRQLEQKANRLAHRLIRLGVKKGDLLGLMMPRGPRMLTGILGILKTGAAYVPLNPGDPAARRQRILADCNSRFLVTVPGFLPDHAGDHDKEPGANTRLRPVYVDDAVNNTELPVEDPGVTTAAGDWAYVIFTSGTTGRPKGVPMAHGNVSPLLHWGCRTLGLGVSDRVLQNLSCYFDWSVWEIFITLVSGASLYTFPEEMLLEPAKSIDLVRRHQITALHATPTRYRFYVQVGKKLDTLKYLFIGAEKFPLDLLRLTVDSVPGACRIFNMYGPTEAAIISAVQEIQPDRLEDYRHLSGVPIGKAAGNAVLLVLDNHMEPCPLNVAGELVIGGDGLSAGYLNDPVKTRRVFVENPYREPGAGNSRLYRTGDRVRRLPDGNIEFLGRVDHQVKIRGFRIEPGEIEDRLLEHGAVANAVVIAREDAKGIPYLCGYVEPQSTGNAPPGELELQAFLRETLPPYMVPARFVFLRRLPLTATGKADRKALPEPGALTLSRDTYSPPQGKLQQDMTALWSGTLGRAPGDIGAGDDFFEIGGNSLLALELLGKIHEAFHVTVSIRDLWGHSTVRELCGFLEQSDTCRHLSIEPVEEKEYYLQAPAQRRFFVFQQLDPGNTSYNMPEKSLLEGKLDNRRFEGAFKRLVRRHESLRTTFHLIRGNPVQKIHGAHRVPVSIRYHEEPSTFDFSRFVRPFDLGGLPLFRVELVRLEEDKHILAFDMHHIITDGVSMSIFLTDFVAAYQDSEQAPPRVRYRDFAHWRNSRRRYAAGKEQKDGHSLPTAGRDAPDLPTDFPRTSRPAGDGADIEFEISAAETAVLKQLALSRRVTPYMVLLAAYTVLLSRLGGGEDIVVGSPIAGRTHSGLEGVMGLFINTLPIRAYPGGRKSFSQLLQEVRSASLDAYENQEFRYEALVEVAQRSLGGSRNPLFDVMFVLQNMAAVSLEVPGLSIKPLPGENRTSKFDLTLFASEEEDKLEFTLEYRTCLFKETTIRRFAGYYRTLLASILRYPDGEIARLDWLPEQEKNRLLYGFNHTAAPYPRERTLHRLFEDQVERTPHRTALSGPAGGTGPFAGREHQLTYDQLNRGANRLARLLAQKGAGDGSVTALLMSPSLLLPAMLLAVMKAGGVYVPVNAGYPAEQVASVLSGCRASYLAVREDLRPWNPGEVAPGVELLAPEVLVEQAAGLRDDNLSRAGKPDDLLYIIFTSGSTGDPKGAGVYHRGYVNLVHWFVTDFQLEEKDRNLLMTSFSFDLTQKNFYAPLIRGGTLFLTPRDQYDPGKVLPVIRKQGLTWLNCTPSMFFYLIQRDEGDRFKSLETLRYVFLGGEPLVMSMFLEWVQSPRCRGMLVNTYGPTECTDISNAFRVREPLEYLDRPVPLGGPISNVRLYVLDRYAAPLPTGVAGELCIAGDSIGRGYVNDPSLTEERFVTVPLDGKDVFLYRTGDLAKWLPGGWVEFIGRKDHQVKVRGFRIELGAIEKRLMEVEPVKEAVVMARESGRGEKYLCAYIVPRPGEEENDRLSGARLKHYLSRRLPGYMVPDHVVLLERMPLSPNGKVDRKSLPEPGGSGGDAGDYVPPATPWEEDMVEIWMEALRFDRNRTGLQPIGTRDNFFQLGGNSLSAIQMVNSVFKKYHVNLPLSQIFDTPTVRELARFIEAAPRTRRSTVAACEKRDYYPLTHAQGRMFVLHHMKRDDLGYNMPLAFELEGRLDRRRLEESFRSLIRRHQMLRTSFHLLDGEPVQRVREDVSFELEKIAPGTAGKNFVRPFDLSLAPLFRVGLSRAGERRHVLMVDAHHIISDGISHGILFKEFAAVYGGRELPPPRLQYRDYALWVNRDSWNRRITAQEAWWLEVFHHEVPPLNLPLDRPRPMIQSYDAASLTFEVREADTAALKHLAAKEGMTLFMVLLAAIGILLHKLCGNEDIVIGTPVSGRPLAELQEVTGIFINTLPLRCFPIGNTTVAMFLNGVKLHTLRALENQEYPFEHLVEKVVNHRAVNRNPLFDVMWSMQDDGVPAVHLEDLSVREYPLETGVSPFDLSFHGADGGDTLVLTIQYGTQLFEHAGIRLFAGYLERIIRQVPAYPGRALHGIDILDSEQRRQLLYGFNRGEAPVPPSRTISGWFRHQVETTPDSAAIVAPAADGRERAVTYRELFTRARGAAAVLKDKGAAAGSIVAFETGPSLETAALILGILDGGGAYLPIAADCPPERAVFMLKDSRAAVLIRGTLKWAPNSPGAGNDAGPAAVLDWDALVAAMDRGRDRGPARDGAQSPPGTGTAALFNILYTSGTTGRPKGVAVEQPGVVNLVSWFGRAYGLRQGKRLAMVTDFTFDPSVEDMFGTLLHGSSLYLVPREMLAEPDRLLHYLGSRCIQLLDGVPSLLEQLLAAGRRPGCLETVISGGERLPESLKDRLLEKGYRLFNHYGPTEVTVDALVAQCDHRPVSLGHPISNVRCYVLDRRLQPVPVGVAGELYIGGAGVARGYLNNPELTAERFPADPFVPGARMYASGDGGRWLPNGEIQFLGRLDRQVKIRGFRIECAEIETLLTAHPSVKSAVVCGRKDPGGQELLAAYVVPVPQARSLEQEEFEAPLPGHLSRQLPGYMLPSVFVRLERIPLTSRGKPDLRRLPELQRQAVSGDRLPKTELEKQLAAIWSDILNIPAGSMPVDADFFRMGGHSLKATVMMNRIMEQLLVRVPLVQLFNHPTIRRLSQYIRGAGRDTAALRDHRLVQLRKSRRNRHLFLVHDGTGGLEAYITLCRRLGADVNCWGIGAEPLPGLAPRNLGMVETAARYLDKLEKIQPRGPYHLAGWSGGGTIAFEMLRQLEARGESCGLFALIDTMPPPGGPLPGGPDITVKGEGEWLERHLPSPLPGGRTIGGLIGGAPDVEALWRQIRSYFDDMKDGAGLIRRFLTGTFGAGNPDVGDLTVDGLIRRLNTLRTLDSLCDGYRPGGTVKSRGHYFAAHREEGNKERGWQEFCRRPMVVENIDAHHFSILEEPAVEQVCTTLDRLLSVEP